MLIWRAFWGFLRCRKTQCEAQKSAKRAMRACKQRVNEENLQCGSKRIATTHPRRGNRRTGNEPIPNRYQNSYNSQEKSGPTASERLNRSAMRWVDYGKDASCAKSNRRGPSNFIA